MESHEGDEAEVAWHERCVFKLALVINVSLGRKDPLYALAYLLILLQPIPDLEEEFNEVVLCDRFAIDSNSLSDGDQMW